MKKHLFLIVVLFSYKIVFSQIQGISIGSGNQKFIEDAVKDGLFIINQKYCLADDSMRYFGRGNMDYFGQTVSVGVKCDNGYVADIKAVAPHKFDPDFNAFADRYAAKIKKTEYCMIDDTLFKPLPYSETGIDTLVADHLFYYCSDVFENKGFVLDNTNDEKNGWLIWVLSDVNRIGYSIQVVRANLRFMRGETEYRIERIKSADNKKILGGVFVVPCYTAIGQVTFKLAGIIGENDGQWIVVKTTEADMSLERIRLKELTSDGIMRNDTTNVVAEENDDTASPENVSAENDTIAPSDADAGGNDDGSNKNKRRWIFGRNKGN